MLFFIQKYGIKVQPTLNVNNEWYSIQFRDGKICTNAPKVLLLFAANYSAQGF